VARAYRPTGIRRLANRMMAGLVRLGTGPRSNYLMTVVGRKTGQPRTTPVTLVENADGRWLVAPYGPVSWVHNARAAGRVTLRRGRRAETVAVTELDAVKAAPVLKQYLTKVPIVRPYFDATPSASLDAFVAEAAHHPVFRIAGPAL
jgi:deazaflavin-dependent oxidoreductase (nitroreductase family)